MKPPRQPTEHERRLWREVTKHDEKWRAEPPIEEESTPPAAELTPLPAPSPAPIPPRAFPQTLPLTALTGRQATRLLRPYAPVEATLDLHGIGKVEAYAVVMDFLSRAQAQGVRHVLIITGKGRNSDGILRASMPQWLNEPGLRRLIVGFAHAPANKGGSGVLHVVLRRHA